MPSLCGENFSPAFLKGEQEDGLQEDYGNYLDIMSDCDSNLGSGSYLARVNVTFHGVCLSVCLSSSRSRRVALCCLLFFDRCTPASNLLHLIRRNRQPEAQ